RGARLQLLQQAMADTPGHAVVSEDAWTALRAGKSVPYSDSTQMATQAITGHWDESGFLANVARRKFPLLVLTYDLTNEVDTPRWSPAALAALQANYEIQYRDALFTHVPRPPPDEPPQPLACSLAGGPRLTGLFLPGGGQRLDAGDVQQLSLYWAATATGQAAGELKISLRLVDDRGAAAWQADLAPGTLAGQAWPGWATSATLRDDFHVALPLTAGPGSYTLALSAYRQQGDQFTPLSLDCADGQGGAVRVLARPQVARPWGE
ncbi:MAG TPA: hypothetical protein VM536_17180, partial [Chloroflexia bacterium]|nr:hypothetical protein [Chloroflexia bacterium]